MRDVLTEDGLAGILQNPPNLDSLSAPAARWGCFFAAKKTRRLRRVRNRQDTCPIYLEVRSRPAGIRLMPRYFFDIKDGHRLVDPAGRECKNDTAAKDMAEALAIVVSIDTPAVWTGFGAHRKKLGIHP